MSVDIDYYELLECERTADDKALKSAYRRLAMQYHPDRNPGDAGAETRFKAISEAYDCLKDPQKRAAYDRYGKAAFQQGSAGGAQDFGGFSDIFEGIFGDFMGGGGGRGRGRQAANRGDDLRYDLEMTLEDAFTGKAVAIEIDVSATCEPCAGSGAKPGTRATGCATCGGAGQVRAQQGLFIVQRTCPKCRGAGRIIAEPCETCHGAGRVERHKSLKVDVPRGVDDGTRIRVTGEGEAGPYGGPPGDLYIFVSMKPHAVWKRDGTTLFAQVPISFTTAALGGTIDVPCLNGEPAAVKVPPGTQSGAQARVRGRGMPVLNGYGGGDVVVQLDVETPVRLGKRQRELFEELRALECDDSCPKATGFFAKIKDAWEDLTD